MHVATLDRGTCLTGVAESAPDRCARGVLELRIFKNNHWIFAAELEHDRRQMFRSSFGDALAGVHTAGKHDLVHTRFDERRASRAIAADDLKQTIRQLRLLEYVCDFERG